MMTDSNPQKIAIFGGSFNPPHLGHVFAALFAKTTTDIDQVWVFPVHKHPYQKKLPSFDLRLQWCRQAFADLSFCRVCDDELQTGGYTIDLVEYLLQHHPLNSWSLIGGTDTTQDLTNWHRGEELADLVSVIDVPRRGSSDAPQALPQISSTMVRNRISAGESCQQLVPESVLKDLSRSTWL